ncbi:carbonic anhydrase [Phreatobacter sp.]|uniref:carbonic anhydrase n=1 Tax=Phreatobacter sp. TaxID=1966341 RepID=UPI003F700D59
MILDHLFDRNAAWAQRKTRDDPTYFVRMAEQQSPELMWIGCSDSRVTANDVLGLDPGAVFVQRNIANMVHTSDMNLLAVLEFAVESLAVGHVIICGHYGCGGVARALGDDRSALVDHWLQPLVMLHRKHRSVFDALAPRARLDRLCELNVQMQMRRVAQTPIVEGAWQRGQPLHVHGWIYGVEDGLLREIEPPVASLKARDALANIDTCAESPTEPQSAVRRHALVAFAVEPAGSCGCSIAAET